ncbi:MAG TPA: RNA-binding S4 domain-containing protein [Clostridiaceae bacterium]|jgi:ribosomal 50S subunit-recycling heat shock protein|nr:RNA-binding S4 domain-containing protein [Clostridiaceae bacterium]
MRLDKFLKVSRVVKRRTVANDICQVGRVKINGKDAKPSSTVKVGDRIEVAFGNGVTAIRVLNVKETVKKEDAASLYEIISGED